MQGQRGLLSPSPLPQAPTVTQTGDMARSSHPQHGRRGWHAPGAAAPCSDRPLLL